MSKNFPENFNTLSEFLSTFAPEVSGRSSDAIPAELLEKLKALASGELGEEESRNISQEILANENAMKILAELLSNNH